MLPFKKRPDTAELEAYMKQLDFPLMHGHSSLGRSFDFDDSFANNDADCEYESSEVRPMKGDDMQRQYRELTDKFNALKKQLSIQTESSCNSVFDNDPPHSNPISIHQPQNKHRTRHRHSSSSSQVADRLFVAQCLSENDSFNYDSQPDDSSSSYTDISFNDTNRRSSMEKKQMSVAVSESLNAQSKSESLKATTVQVQSISVAGVADKDEMIALLQSKLSVKDREIEELKQMLLKLQSAPNSEFDLRSMVNE